MNPVAIFRHSVTEGPGYFATYLDRRRIPWELVRVDAGDAVPEDPAAWSGLVFMGGPMSVNDDLPWIGRQFALIVRAVDLGVPVLGHCLGGQLIAKALGGTVGRNPVKEIGWGEVAVVPGAEAQRWFGGLSAFPAFHWHGETFTVPPGATRILASRWCPNQGFALGPHLGLQCHVEMTPELVRAWCRDWEKEVTSLAKLAPSVQNPEQMQEDLDARVHALNRVADGVYDRWVEGLRRE